MRFRSSSVTTLDSQSSQQIRIIYILYIFGAFIWLVLLFGVILAYVEKGRESESVFLSHLRTQIRVFWIHLISAIAGGIVLAISVMTTIAVVGVGAMAGGGDPATAATVYKTISLLLVAVYGASLIVYVIVASVKGIKRLDAGAPIA
ncbi:MAG: hypothetical protein OXH31_00900 [Gammaproteobacteria bacterium]|nr:hypothetical protein [Gammaproteobacteria bacterium]